MADVRALLRNERLARRITHPHATYSTAGTLSCNVCNLRLQAESLWKPHLAGKVHRQNLQQAQAATAQGQIVSAPVPVSIELNTDSTPQNTTQISNSKPNGKKRKANEENEHEMQQATGKKRKAEDRESEQEERQESSLRKRVKPVSRNNLPTGFVDGNKNEDSSNEQMDVAVTTPTVEEPSATLASTNVDEDEYAAFEAAIAAAPTEDDDTRRITARNILNAGADIAAAPMTAAELASKETDDVNAQRKGKREEEMEGEKEDAARALEEEFDEMDQLETRVKRLREMREKLRVSGQKAAGIQGDILNEDQVNLASHGESDDEDDDYDDDNWGFR